MGLSDTLQQAPRSPIIVMKAPRFVRREGALGSLSRLSSDGCVVNRTTVLHDTIAIRAVGETIRQTSRLPSRRPRTEVP